MGSRQDLFDSSGNWIAVRSGRYIFTPEGAWLGWVGDEWNVFGTDGVYLGTIISDRLFRQMFPADRFDPSHPGYPGREEPFDHPGYPGRFEAPVGMTDVDLLEHA